MRADMQRTLTMLILLTLTAAPSHGQQVAAAPADTLRVWQSLWSTTGFKYQHGPRKGDVGLGGYAVKGIVQDDPAALHEAEVFGRYQVPTFFLSLASAVAIGAGLAKDRSELIYAGIGGLAVSFAFDQVGYSHLKKAARTYNASKSSGAAAALSDK